MTFDERVTALAPLGFTPRQTRFLVTAALLSGYCMRRHYLTFAGVRHGKNVRDFFETLVRRQLAQRLRYRPNRGQIYHLHATALYRALAQRDNRNRRQASPALIARKLMILDYRRPRTGRATGISRISRSSRASRRQDCQRRP